MYRHGVSGTRISPPNQRGGFYLDHHGIRMNYDGEGRFHLASCKPMLETNMGHPRNKIGFDLPQTFASFFKTGLGADRSEPPS